MLKETQFAQGKPASINSAPDEPINPPLTFDEALAKAGNFGKRVEILSI